MVYNGQLKYKKPLRCYGNNQKLTQHNNPLKYTNTFKAKNFNKTSLTSKKLVLLYFDAHYCCPLRNKEDDIKYNPIKMVGAYLSNSCF